MLISLFRGAYRAQHELLKSGNALISRTYGCDTVPKTTCYRDTAACNK